MRIGLDGFPLASPRTGVGHYTFELAQALSRLAPEHQFEIISPSPPPAEVKSQIESISNLHSITPGTNSITRRWWGIGLPRYVKSRALDLFHGTNYEVPLWNRQRNVVTVHDLSVFLHPDKHETQIARRARRRLPIMLRSAAMIITPTEAVKREVCARFKTDPKRIAVTPEAPRQTFSPMTPRESEDVRRRLEIENNFILFVGTIEPRKNLLTLVRAFDRIHRDTPDCPQLVIAGGEGWLTRELHESIGRLGSSNRVRLTGYLNDEELRALYSSCKVFVYPSLYEGFGLPPLEAMACGAPVVAGRNAAHSETLAGNACLVDPLDEQALAKAISELLENENERRRLSLLGLDHAKKFSWEKTARLTLEVYQQVLQKRARSRN